MNTIFEPANGFYHWLWRASWQAAIVAALVVLVQWTFRRRLAPRWSSALWLLVLLRLLWPFSMQSPASVFNWVQPLRTPEISAGILPAQADAEKEIMRGAAAAPSTKINWAARIWIAGMIVLSIPIGITTLKISRRIRRERPVTDSALLELLEDCKATMAVHTPLTLVETREVASPLLYGFIRPRLLLPAGLSRDFSPSELRHIFMHELSHLKRGDIPLNWLMTAALVMHWFNPFIWFAFHRMRADRELACDALALSYAAPDEGKRYGETIIRLVEQFSRPAWGPGMVGIIEEKNQIKRRIRMIATSKNARRWPALAAVLFGTLGIITLTEAQSNPGATAEKSAAATGDVPRIVATSPEIGARDVDPSLKEITVTFDRDMAGGFSWTGGGPDFPQAPNEKPVWRNKRTCAMPVKLEAGHYYRVGINSQSHQNFRTKEGIPAKPTAFYFTTKGAGPDVLQKAARPEIVSITPKNGATDVDPNTAELRVTFNVPMGGGFSWTGGGPQFPPAPEGKKPYWTPDKKTCVLPVQLKAASEYRIGLNSPSHKNFQSETGIPLEPLAYSFKTK